jgi:hypothetical protein
MPSYCTYIFVQFQGHTRFEEFYCWFLIPRAALKLHKDQMLCKLQHLEFSLLVLYLNFSFLVRALEMHRPYISHEIATHNFPRASFVVLRLWYNQNAQPQLVQFDCFTKFLMPNNLLTISFSSSLRPFHKKVRT